jgi:ATP-dependent 26S proteasome regulatory subunit
MNESKVLQATDELSTLVKSRHPIIYIINDEKERNVLSQIYSITNGSKHKKNLYVWDIYRGLIKRTYTDGLEIPKPIETGIVDPISILDYILDPKSDPKAIYVLCEFHHFFRLPEVQRRLRVFAEDISEEQKKSIVLLSTKNDGVEGSGKLIPTELENIVNLFDWPYPDEITIKDALTNGIIPMLNSNLEANGLKPLTFKDDELVSVVNACKGMTIWQIENATTKSIVKTKRLDPKTISLEKKQIIHKSGLCEYVEPSETLSDIGGVSRLKRWLSLRKNTLTEEAHEFGCSYPKGVLLIGPWGSGKSSAAKAIINEWGLPGIRVDASRLYNKYLGNSEKRTREILKLAESISPVILWFDEVENMMAMSGGSNDGGTSSRVVGIISTWMAEHEGLVFCIFTANEINNSPPKLFRKGRLDEIFIVDLPVKEEREEIFKIHISKRLKKQGKDKLIPKIDYQRLAVESVNFSGAEIENAVDSAIRLCFFEGKRDIKTEDLQLTIKESIPMAVTMREKIEQLREWQKGRAIPASEYEPEPIGDVVSYEKRGKKEIDF